MKVDERNGRQFSFNNTALLFSSASTLLSVEIIGKIRVIQVGAEMKFDERI